MLLQALVEHLCFRLMTPHQTGAWELKADVLNGQFARRGKTSRVASGCGGRSLRFHESCPSIGFQSEPPKNDLGNEAHTHATHSPDLPANFLLVGTPSLQQFALA